MKITVTEITVARQLFLLK